MEIVGRWKSSLRVNDNFVISYSGTSRQGEVEAAPKTIEGVAEHCICCAFLTASSRNACIKTCLHILPTPRFDHRAYIERSKFMMARDLTNVYS